MCRLLVLVLAAGLLGPAPALAGNDYPGGGGLGPAPPAEGVQPAIPTPPLVTEEQTVLPAAGAVVGQPFRSQGRTGRGSLHNAIVPLITTTLIPPAEVEWTDVTRPGGNYTQMFPSASQPTSSSLPSSSVSQVPGQLYPSANQPATSTAGR